MPARAQCDEYTGFISLMNHNQVEYYCEYREGVFSTTAPCPPPPLVGTCSFHYVFGAETPVERHYPPADPAIAWSSCNDRGGTWAVPAA